MNESTPEQPMLDGLDIAPEQGQGSKLRVAVIATLEALKSEGLLEPRHAAVSQLTLELADAVAVGVRTRKASAAAMAAAQLLQALDALPKPMAADTAQKFDELLENLRNS
ncbi:hypothetical protein M2152_002002 [Microbacteriaceae bacterium SG_E_30_P1]|uniref:Transcriptional regulator n=1 Tax=Antiquaquibacter oligotrophicus TaxID=2880260 RepID=A0ABT6KPA5_9MICO|nr:hypothetical protein [Antiquaquibacter oligotrophicus]MDH6181820.1 hypothetical protein [Antiquaquibacter oligotrophicus]UDF12502.1 hypothetical protein LH407_10095 [Antiquaquibacter oligotrophicus]